VSLITADSGQISMYSGKGNWPIFYHGHVKSQDQVLL
jgi:hypothetical protein